jgi:hypothetical protein
MNAERRAFLVGRVTPRAAEMVVVNGTGAPPFPGPWTLKALIRVPDRLPSIPPSRPREKVR